MSTPSSSHASNALRLAQSLKLLPPDQRLAALKKIATTPEEAATLLDDWHFWARRDQIAPDGPSGTPEGDWDVWLTCAGRGWGKTRTGAEWVQERVTRGAKRLALCGRTAKDVRDTMVEGESGLLNTAPRWNRPTYEPSKSRLTWPSGAVATTYSADQPGSLRGPNVDTVWADELAAWRYPDAWVQLTMVLRSLASGLRPRAIVTTTPRPTPVVKSILRDPSTYVTRGSTYDNAANLHPAWFARVKRLYEGSRLGLQELHARVLDDAPGALWTRGVIERNRLNWRLGIAPRLPRLLKIVVAVDPATTSGEASNETGIIVVGLGENGHGYVLDDLSGRYPPERWARIVVDAYDDWEADEVVAEVNQGGDLVTANIRTVRRTIPVKTVHASRGKRTRAEPVATLYEQNRIHHVGVFDGGNDTDEDRTGLETQMCTWQPAVVDEEAPVKHPQLTDSPDRIDALVWGVTFLMIDRDPNKKNAGRARGGMTRRVSIDDRSIG